MKAEQRKQLEQNELASRLTGWWKGSGDANKSSKSWFVLGAVVLVVVLIIAYRYFSESAARTKADGWKRIEQATSADELQGIVEANRGTAIGRAAKAQLARLSFDGGLRKLSSQLQRSEGISDIEKARTLYGELAKEAKDDPMLQREALLASAKAEESLVAVPKADAASESRGSLDRAIELYEEAAQKFADSPQGKIAAERAKEVRENKEKVQQFYEDLNKHFAKSSFPAFPIEPTPKDPPPPIPPFPDPIKPAEPMKPATPLKPLEPPPSEPKKTTEPAKPMGEKPLTPPPEKK